MREQLSTAAREAGLLHVQLDLYLQLLGGAGRGGSIADKVVAGQVFTGELCFKN